MPTVHVDAADDSRSMLPTHAQAQSWTFASRQAAPHFLRSGPGSVNRSETGISIDLSAASNVAAPGEEPLDGARRTGGSMASLSRSESRMRPSDAEKWFQDSNKNASTRGNVSFTDDDPPFHLPQRINKEPPSRLLPVRTVSGTSQFAPPSLRNMQSVQSSSSGEFRSVIDDLTVENKSLRKRLRKYERTNASHLHPDRMFEVRMPGLIAKDKQRLERLLKDFADSISGSDMSGPYPKSTKKASKRGSSVKPSSSSSTLHSNSNPSNNLVDSAYASASISAGNTSGSQSQQDSRLYTNEGNGRKSSRQEGSRSKDQRVRSYLQNISQGLLPRRSTAMTEKARKREIVKRLEQLFTGKDSTNTKNSQSVQQQEVSAAAATADKKASEARGRPAPNEGTREAPILPAEAEAAMLRQDSGAAKGKDNSSPNEGANQVTPDQRPTQPLDLDLNRAQNAAENMAYIRHLGFKPNTALGEDRADEDGWVYLNLLIGMAQLHTINVTIDSVRQAIKDLSDKFELSSDGAKVRWRGGTEGTRLGGDDGSSVHSKNGSPPEGALLDGVPRAVSPRSRSSKPSTSDQMTGVKMSGGLDDHSGTKDSSRDRSAGTDLTSSIPVSGSKRPVFLGHVGGGNSFKYEPMFLHGAASDEENDYFLNESDSLLSSGLREDVTGSGGSSQRTRHTPVTGLGQIDGPMIFYHRARFVTDLSGDQGFTPVNHTRYTQAVEHPFGSEAPVDKSLANEMRGILSNPSPQVVSAMTYFPEEEPKLPKFEESSAPSPSYNYSPQPYELPVHGLGGIMPGDNFVFYPKHRQLSRKRKQPQPDMFGKYRKCMRRVRAKLFDGNEAILRRIPAQDKLDVRLQGAGPVAHAELEPSQLPPPNYVHMPLGSSADENSWGSDDESEGDDDLTGDGDQVPELAPPRLMRTYEETGDGSDSDASDEDEDMLDADDDDEEFDLLAHERALNAEEVAEREREWEEENKDPTPDAHSSAATVGDRSFLSDEAEEESSDERNERKRTAHVGSKRGRDELEGTLPVDSSPAKRVETPRTKNGKK